MTRWDMVKLRWHWWNVGLRVTRARVHKWGIGGVVVNAMAQKIVAKEQETTGQARLTRVACRSVIRLVQLGSEILWRRILGNVFTSTVVAVSLAYGWHILCTQLLLPTLQDFGRRTVTEQHKMLEALAQHPAPTVWDVIHIMVLVLLFLLAIMAFTGSWYRHNDRYYARYARACVQRKEDDDL